MTFKQKLQTARKKSIAKNSDVRLKSDVAINDALKRESIKTLTTVLTTVTEDLGLDLEKMERRIKSARKSAYGRVTEMVCILASTYAWPVAESSQAKEIPELQERMLDSLSDLGINIDGDLLLDIKEAKGYNSFLDKETFTVVDGVEPEFDELQYYLLTFAETAKLPFIDYKMTETVYDKLETKALARIEAEQKSAQEALDRHAEMTKQTEKVA